MSAPDISHGKQFEKDLSAVFSDLYKSYPVRFERTLDSADAGNVVRSADSDFRFLIRSADLGRPFVFYIECKASVTGKAFDGYFRSLVKPNQNASMAAVRRAGASAVVLYRDLANNTIEAWYGVSVNAAYPHKRTKIDDIPFYITRGDDDGILNLATAWVLNPAKFIQRGLS